jgi:hypothetical protein
VSKKGVSEALFAAIIYSYSTICYPGLTWTYHKRDIRERERLIENERRRMATKTESFLSRALAKSRTSSELSTSSEEDNMIHGMTRQHSLENFRLEADRDGWKEIHGFRGNMHWNSPCQVMNEGDSVVMMSTCSPSRRRVVHYEDE